MATTMTRRRKRAKGVELAETFDDREKALYDKLRPYLVDMLAAGHTVNQIARMGLSDKDNAKKALRLEKKLSAMIQHDGATKLAIYEKTQEILVAALPKAAVALSERVEAGRPDAIKLLFELSGAYTKTEKHEHSGQVEIKMTGVPRPARVESEVIEADAEELE